MYYEVDVPTRGLSGVDRAYVSLPVVLSASARSITSVSKAIYIIKMELMSERIDLGMEERRHLHRMTNFFVLFYAKYFLRSRSIAVFAPHDDSKFIGSMISYC